MKTTPKTPMHSTDELWQWAAESGWPAQKGYRSRSTRVRGESASPRLAMAQGMLARLCAILRGSGSKRPRR